MPSPGIRQCANTSNQAETDSMDVTLRDYKFFKENGGYIVGRRALAAIHLARAEKLAQFHGYTFEWDWDDDADLGDHEEWCTKARRAEAEARGGFIGSNESPYLEHSHETYYAVMKSTEGDIVDSLGGIIDPSSDYRRVVEAELALEHFMRQGTSDQWFRDGYEAQDALNKALAIGTAIYTGTP